MIEAPTRRVTLFPAIDLRRGRCVRLEQGSAERETEYGTDPFRVAEEFARQGAEWVHVVDLDAAFGEGSNRPLIRDLAESIPLKVQTGGGLRTEADLEEVLAGPIRRAVIGTAAVENPELVALAVRRWGADRIAVGLDARGRKPAVRGWREESGADLFDLAASLTARGLRTLIYTDIDRDGMLAGPNLDTAAELAERSGAEVVISGGVSGPADLAAIADAARDHPGLVGVIVGKALYEGRVEVSGAVELLSR
ncbi:MAG TPA: 1-(5-phosphoribosyl)-5-[(5-phosphoribosylamino)methylideneamino]imidazole-4-carboxamide isomerase [Longimicrobiaceae bacterium]|nr:1-(5-phosphoribosyl)-5-[(5-phosphoribosylamino)methylideneamino]imidazole-4-carboxamide isomerase [Longimicrobiaceae bacterium]